MPDHLNANTAAHVPSALCYGPVSSRRFGRSLGISCSPPSVWACAWRCPYCQQGGERKDPNCFADPKQIVDELAQRLAEAKGDGLDAVTIAGGGEPTDHPAFAAIATDTARLATRHGLRTILLTNGDGLVRPEVRAACSRLDAVYVKWDPGPQGGIWSDQQAEATTDRLERLRVLPWLRVQSMLFLAGSGAGNSGQRCQQAWLTDLERLAPREVHLTTVERQAPRADIRPVGDDELAAWQRIGAQKLGIPVRCFPARQVT